MFLPLLLLACTSTLLPVDTGTDPIPDPAAVQEHLASDRGDFALDFLRPEPFDALQIEVDWVRSHPPDPHAIEALAATIADLCDKPRGVRVIWDDRIDDPGAEVWTDEALDRLESTWRSRYRDEETGTAALWVLYVDGRCARDDDDLKRLATTPHAASMVVFAETLDAIDLGLLTPQLEQSVLRHELGHLLGLVDRGVPMVAPHEDPDHPGHCAVPRCTMYWLLDTSWARDALRAAPPAFDPACLDDLEQARTGARVP